MAQVLLWIGICLTVIGWIAIAWQASKRMARKDEIDRFPDLKKTMQLHRNYCWLTIAGGILLIVIALII